MQKDQAKKLESIAERFGVSEIYVFGSRANEIKARVAGESTAWQLSADVDIGIQPVPGNRLSIDEKVNLAIALEDFFNVERVDLVVIPEADPFLAADIIRGEILYCSDPDEQAITELHILRTAGDLAYFKRERIKSILSETT